MIITVQVEITGVTPLIFDKINWDEILSSFEKNHCKAGRGMEGKGMAGHARKVLGSQGSKARI